jgi:hypothetical protein
MQRIDDGRKSVPKIDLTFSSDIIPIQIEIRPTPDAASWAYDAANVASCTENFSKVADGNFIFILTGSIKNTKTTGALT